MFSVFICVVELGLRYTLVQLAETTSVMFSQPRRPLPATPDLASAQQQYFNNYGYTSADIYAASSPFLPPAPYPHYASQSQPAREEGAASLPGGTLLHKGFYDLLALIPSTTTASRFLWGPQQNEEEPMVAGPKYENISPRSPTRPGPTSPASPASPNASPRKGRRLSKDMVSKPMNFV